MSSAVASKADEIHHSAMKTDKTNPFREWRKSRGLTLEQLAELLGKPRSYTGNLSRLERGTLGYSDELLGELARIFGVSKAGVLAGPAPREDGDNFKHVTRFPQVPEISWIAAGQLQDIGHIPYPEEGEWPLIEPKYKVGKRAWALRVDGDSMDDGTDEGIKKGWIIIVDPDKAAHAGSFVIAKDVNTQKATFKQLVTDGGRWFLKPLNPRWPIVEIDDPAIRVIGVVTEAQPPTRKLT